MGAGSGQVRRVKKTSKFSQKNIVFNTDKWNAWIEESDFGDVDITKYYLGKDDDKRGTKPDDALTEYIFKEIFADMFAAGAFESTAGTPQENFEITIANTHQPGLYDATELEIVVTNTLTGKQGIKKTNFAPYMAMYNTGYLLHAIAEAMQQTLD